MIIQDQELKDIERLRWQCRRGMLELDVLLERFLDQTYETLPPRLQRHFVQLLEFPDPIIHSWCINGVEPEDDEFSELINTIRSTQLA